MIINIIQCLDKICELVMMTDGTGWQCLQVMLNSGARSTAWVSFDGRNQEELKIGDRSEL